MNNTMQITDNFFSILRLGNKFILSKVNNIMLGDTEYVTVSFLWEEFSLTVTIYEDVINFKSNVHNILYSNLEILMGTYNDF